MAVPFRGKAEVVVGPEKGGILLSHCVGAYLDTWNHNDNSFPGEVVSVYAEKSGDEFVFGRGYDQFIPGKRILIVEDVLTTGGSVKRVINAVGKLGGIVVGVSAICNRGGVTEADLGVVPPAVPPSLRALVKVDLQDWDEVECPLCEQGVPINTNLGKGKEFLARKQKQ